METELSQLSSSILDPCLLQTFSALPIAAPRLQVPPSLQPQSAAPTLTALLFHQDLQLNLTSKTQTG